MLGKILVDLLDSFSSGLGSGQRRSGARVNGSARIVFPLPFPFCRRPGRLNRFLGTRVHVFDSTDAGHDGHPDVRVGRAGVRILVEDAVAHRKPRHLEKVKPASASPKLTGQPKSRTSPNIVGSNAGSAVTPEQEVNCAHL